MLQRVLVLSDKTDIIDFIDSALGNEGFAVLTLQDSIEGIKHVYDALPDVIILEDRLSATDSVDLCSQIRRLPHIPIIMLGDEEGDSSLIKGLQRGADFYMRRPISVPELVARVKALLRRRGEWLEAVHQFLNVEEVSIVVDNLSIKLTPTEFRLLSYLVLNRDRVIPVEELLAQVWIGQDVTGNILKFYVCRLRQKLNHSSPHNIFNHRGMGYRLAYAKEQEAINEVDMSWVMPKGGTDWSMGAIRQTQTPERRKNGRKNEVALAVLGDSDGAFPGDGGDSGFISN